LKISGNPTGGKENSGLGESEEERAPLRETQKGKKKGGGATKKPQKLKQKNPVWLQTGGRQWASYERKH